MSARKARRPLVPADLEPSVQKRASEACGTAIARVLEQAAPAHEVTEPGRRIVGVLQKAALRNRY